MTVIFEIKYLHREKFILANIFPYKYYYPHKIFRWKLYPITKWKFLVKLRTRRYSQILVRKLTRSIHKRKQFPRKYIHFDYHATSENPIKQSG